MAAMTIELDEILKFMEIQESFENGDYPMYKGTIEGKEVIVGLSGVGAVKSAMTMTQMLERFDVDCFINIGTAGGLQEIEQPLDVIVSDQVMKYDFDYETVYGIELGFTDKNPYIFKTDTRLQNLAKKVMESLSDSRVFIGNIVSGDKFICKKEDVEFIQKYYPSAYCGDMEAACVSQVCDFYKVPFVVVRSLSDIVLHEGNEMEFSTYAQLASARSAMFVKELVKEI